MTSSATRSKFRTAVRAISAGSGSGGRAGAGWVTTVRSSVRVVVVVTVVVTVRLVGWLAGSAAALLVKASSAKSERLVVGLCLASIGAALLGPSLGECGQPTLVKVLKKAKI